MLIQKLTNTLDQGKISASKRREAEKMAQPSKTTNTLLSFVELMNKIHLFKTKYGLMDSSFRLLVIMSDSMVRDGVVYSASGINRRLRGDENNIRATQMILKRLLELKLIEVVGTGKHGINLYGPSGLALKIFGVLSSSVG